MKVLISGFGINDADYPVSSSKSKSGNYCPYYARWVSMIYRCYGNPSGYKAPGYDDCTVCDEWKSFMSFRVWMAKQDWEGNQLDKDIINYGSKVYSPDTCAFIPKDVNCAIIRIDSGNFKKKKEKLEILASSQNDRVKCLLLNLIKSLNNLAEDPNATSGCENTIKKRRPTKHGKVCLPIYMTSDDYESFKSLTNGEGLTMSGTVAQLIKKYIRSKTK